jgi:[acyl-carrier-protein] S-malonyltransferase
MGVDLYKQSDLGKTYFDRANEIMGYDLREIIFSGPEESLRETKNTQPAIYIVSVILGELLKARGIEPAAAAGHSLGEYSALTLAGAFDFETGLKLVKVRAQGMQAAGKARLGTMAAIIGLSDEKVVAICSETEAGIVVAANYNAPGQVVISGEVPAVKAAMEAARKSGARKAILLNVSGAFHSPLMGSARETLAEMLKSIEIQDCHVPVYVNVSATPVQEAVLLKKALMEQLESPVLWHQTMVRIVKDGFSSGIEVGPGRVLQGLARRIDRNFSMTGVETMEQVNQFDHA